VERSVLCSRADTVPRCHASEAAGFCKVPAASVRGAEGGDTGSMENVEVKAESKQYLMQRSIPVLLYKIWQASGALLSLEG